MKDVLKKLENDEHYYVDESIGKRKSKHQRQYETENVVYRLITVQSCFVLAF